MSIRIKSIITSFLVESVIVFFLIALFTIQSSAAEKEEGRLSLSIGGGWGNFISGNTASGSRISNGPSFSAGVGSNLWRKFDVNFQVIYVSGKSRMDRWQAFPDNYGNWMHEGELYSVDLIAPGLILKYSYHLNPFDISPGVGIFYLFGRAKYPTFIFTAPPEAPGPMPDYFRARDFGYQVSLQSSFKVWRGVGAYSEFAYRFFKLPIPEASNGNRLSYFDFNLSGPSANCGLILWVF